MQNLILEKDVKVIMPLKNIFTEIMKQKMFVQYFEQRHWYIESRLV